MRSIKQFAGCFCVFVLPGLFVAQASAGVSTVITVPNASFELPASTDGNYKWTSVSGDSTTIPGWTYFGTTGGGGAQNSINAEFPGTSGSPGNLPGTGDGLQYGWLNLVGDSAQIGLLVSGTVAQIQAYSQYTLTVAMGDRLNEEPAEEGIAFLANGSVPVGGEQWISGFNLIEGGFSDLTVTLTTGGPSDPLVGQNLAVRMMERKALTSGVSVNQGNFDNVRLTVTPVPEPVAMFQAIVIVGALSRCRKRAAGLPSSGRLRWI